MSFILENFLSYGSLLLYFICFTCCGLACWRLSKVLREKSFAFAAIAGGIYVVLWMLLALYQNVAVFFPAVWAEGQAVASHIYQVVFLLEPLFFLALSVAAVRCGLMAKRAAIAREVVQE